MIEQVVNSTVLLIIYRTAWPISLLLFALLVLLFILLLAVRRSIWLFGRILLIILRIFFLLLLSVLDFVVY